MLSVNSQTIGFDSVAKSVKEITDTKNTFRIDVSDQDIMNRVCDIDNYSEYGLKSLGRIVGFPAPFIAEVGKTNKPLANKVVNDRLLNYSSQDKRELYAREFSWFAHKENCSYICGVVTDKYAYFDDDEVVDIISDSPLADYRFQYALTTPERLHLRAIDLDNPFKVDGDDSNLFLMYYVDNSMVGQSAFKIRVGVYRQVCSNGMIVPVQSFVLCRAVHKGSKDIAAEFNQSIAFLSEKKEQIQTLISKKTSETATIQELQNEFKKTYVAKNLNLSDKEADKIIVLFDIYALEYGRPSKWAFINAVTQFARDLPEGSLDKRLYLENKAFKVA